MCLGEIGEVLALDEGYADVRLETRPGALVATVSLLALTEPVAVGDRVLVHTGFALARLTEAEAADAAALRRGGEERSPA